MIIGKIRATIITIGDELLIGQIVDTNSPWMANLLSSAGVQVVRRIAVADDSESIQGVLRQEIAEGIDFVILTGGLGPTDDDITKATLCAFFDDQVVLDPVILRHVEEFFAKRNRPMLPRNVRQAEVPSRCKVLFNRLGTAPGMLFLQGESHVISLPGVPFEMKALMEEHVLPIVREKTTAQQAIVHEHIFTFGEGESFLAERIADIEAGLPKHIRLAYLPVPFAVRLRLTSVGVNAKALAVELRHYRDELAMRIGADKILAYSDLSVAQLVVSRLQELGLSLAVAESCTGGLLSGMITDVAGSSKVYKGGLCSYATDIKTSVLHVSSTLINEKGVVSAEVAESMAEESALLLGADIGIGITGILSASDYYEDRSPEGTIFIGLSYAGKVYSSPYMLRHDRRQNKESAAFLCLCLLLKLLNQQ